VLGTTTDPTDLLEADPATVPMTTLSFEESCEAAWPSLVRFLRATAGPDLDIEDLAAQVMEVAWRRRDTLVDPDGAVPWLLAIAHHTVRNARRSLLRRARLRRRLQEHEPDRPSHPSAHAELLRSEPGPATRALASLGERDREILVLHAWEDLDNARIAEVLGISNAAVAQRLHRARTRLAAALDSREDRA
jgi:RNA polymerase sigma-70 factor (ECF subfamily)